MDVKRKLKIARDYLIVGLLGLTVAIDVGKTAVIEWLSQ